MKNASVKHIKQYLRDLWRRRDLLFYQIVSGLKADTRNTFLGYFWWLLDPLLMVLTFAFLRVVFLGRTGENLVAFLAVGLVVFQFFAQNLTGSARSITAQAGIITQVYMPKAIFPISTVLTQLVNFGFAFVTLAIIFVFSRILPGIEVLWLPAIIIIQLAFHLAIALIMAYISAFVRDLQRILGHFTRILRFTAPVIWEADRIPENYQWMLEWNPFAWLVMAYRDVLMYGQVPNMLRLAWLGLASAGIAALLLVFYTYNEHRIIKVL